MTIVTPANPVRQRIKFNPIRQVDIAWLRSAACLGGKSASVAIALWSDVSASGNPETMVTPSLLRRFGVSREGGYAAIARLEQAGLLVAERQRGRSARVRLLSNNGLSLVVPGGRLP